MNLPAVEDIMHKPIRSLLVLGVLVVLTIVSIGTWSHHQAFGNKSSLTKDPQNTAEYKAATAVPYEVLIPSNHEKQQHTDLVQQLGTTGMMKVHLSKDTKTHDDSYWRWETTIEQDPETTKLKSSIIKDCKDVPIPPYVRQGMERVGKTVAQLLLYTVSKDEDTQKPNHEHDTMMVRQRRRAENHHQHPPKISNKESLCHGDVQYWVHSNDDDSPPLKLQEVEQVGPPAYNSGLWHLLVATPYHRPAAIESDDHDGVVIWVALNRNVLMGGDAHDTPIMDATSTEWYSRSYTFTSFPEDAIQNWMHEANKKSHSDDSVSYSSDDEPPFCMPGMSMVMFMDGFRRSLGGASKQQSCLNYYFRTWTLEEVGKFNGALVFSFLLAILTEGLSTLRTLVYVRMRKGPVRRTCLTVLYGMQSFMGYTIMLAAMMYSIEILLAVVIGLALGNRLFVRERKATATAVAPRGAPQQVNHDPHRQPLLNNR